VDSAVYCRVGLTISFDRGGFIASGRKSWLNRILKGQVMKNWDDVSAQMQLNGTPLSVLGYCRIAFDEGRGSYDLLKASFEDNATETIQLREKLTAQWQRAESAEKQNAEMKDLLRDIYKVCGASSRASHREQTAIFQRLRDALGVSV